MSMRYGVAGATLTYFSPANLDLYFHTGTETIENRHQPVDRKAAHQAPRCRCLSRFSNRPFSSEYLLVMPLLVPQGMALRHWHRAVPKKLALT